MKGSQRSRVSRVVWETAKATSGATGTMISAETTGIRLSCQSDAPRQLLECMPLTDCLLGTLTTWVRTV